MKKLREVLAVGLVGLAYIQTALLGLLVLVAELQILASDFGTFVAFLGLFFFPVVVTAMPFYAGVVHGNWNLLILSVGAFVVYWVLLTLASVISPSD